MTRWCNTKLPNFSQYCPKSPPNHFTWKLYDLNSHKNYHTICALLVWKFVTLKLKKTLPIWSNWSYFRHLRRCHVFHKSLNHLIFWSDCRKISNILLTSISKNNNSEDPINYWLIVTKVSFIPTQKPWVVVGLSCKRNRLNHKIFHYRRILL